MGNTDFKQRYDDICQSQLNSGNDCTFTITLDSDIEKPHIYYEIGNFFANHRKFVKSRSYMQLRGNKVSKGDVKEFCDPIIENKEVPVTLSYTGVSLKPDDIAYPCGLIGKYRFTDTFSIVGPDSSTLIIDSSGIAHKNDKKYKFKNTGQNGQIQWLDFEEQRLMVWYQMESFPKFTKLYGEIDQTMKKGTYTITVSNQWDTKSFKAEKFIYFSTINGLGGTNVFLGVVFIILCFFVLVIMGIIIGLEFTRGSKPSHYSIENLKW
jgi:hypothetical protein